MSHMDQTQWFLSLHRDGSQSFNGLLKFVAASSRCHLEIQKVWTCGHVFLASLCISPQFSVIVGGALDKGLRCWGSHFCSTTCVDFWVPLELYGAQLTNCKMNSLPSNLIKNNHSNSHNCHLWSLTKQILCHEALWQISKIAMINIHPHLTDKESDTQVDLFKVTQELNTDS